MSAVSIPLAGATSVANLPGVSSEPPANETLLCAVCHAPLTPSRTGSERRFCSSACRLKAHRGSTRSAPEVPQNRDSAVHALCMVILREDGLRNGMDALSRIFADEHSRLAALPEYTRRDFAGRIVAALDLSLKDAP